MPPAFSEVEAAGRARPRDRTLSQSVAARRSSCQASPLVCRSSRRRGHDGLHDRPEGSAPPSRGRAGRPVDCRRVLHEHGSGSGKTRGGWPNRAPAFCILYDDSGSSSAPRACSRVWLKGEQILGGQWPPVRPAIATLSVAPVCGLPPSSTPAGDVGGSDRGRVRRCPDQTRGEADAGCVDGTHAGNRDRLRASSGRASLGPPPWGSSITQSG